MAKAPWYKRFATDFVSDPYVQAMTAEQYGWYSAALDMMWIHTPQGCLPNDLQLLSKMIGRCDEMHFAAASKIVLDRFQVSEDGKWLFHPKMMQQVDHVSEVSEKRRDAGKLGGKNKAQQKPSKCEAIAKQMPTDSDSEVEKSRGALAEVADDQMAAKSIQIDYGFQGPYVVRDLSEMIAAIRSRENCNSFEAADALRERWEKAKASGVKSIWFWAKDGHHLAGKTAKHNWVAVDEVAQ